MWIKNIMLVLGSGFWNSPQFGSGSEPFHTLVLSIKKKTKLFYTNNVYFTRTPLLNLGIQNNDTKKFWIKMVNFCQWVHPFYPIFNWWIRIRIRNTDPDPQSCWIGTDPIWIWIHNTAINKLNQNELEFFVVKLFCLCGRCWVWPTAWVLRMAGPGCWPSRPYRPSSRLSPSPSAPSHPSISSWTKTTRWPPPKVSCFKTKTTRCSRPRHQR